jgi:hypothetical protein
MSVAVDLQSEQPDIVARLDELNESDHGTWIAERAAIMSLTPQMISERYGHEVLVWAAANADGETETRCLVDALVELAGYDRVLLSKAIKWSKLRHNSSRGSLVIAGYRLAEAVLMRRVEIDVPGLLRRSAAPGVELSDKRIEEYAVLPVQAGGMRTPGFIPETYAEVEPNTYYKSAVDGPLGFLLVWRHRPQAVVAIGACTPNEIMIYQMQGIVGKMHDSPVPEAPVIKTLKERGLAPLVWRRLLIELIDDIGSQIKGFRTVAIQEGAQNQWTGYTTPGESAPHLTLDAARRAYDIPAEEAGFKRGDDGNWHRPLGYRPSARAGLAG